MAAILYALRMGRQAGGLLRLYRRMRTRNACKTCALGMGGQHGGMVNEAGHFPEVCKKSLQAQAGDMQGPLGEAQLREYPLERLAGLRGHVVIIWEQIHGQERIRFRRSGRCVL